MYRRPVSSYCLHAWPPSPNGREIPVVGSTARVVCANAVTDASDRASMTATTWVFMDDLLITVTYLCLILADTTSWRNKVGLRPGDGSVAAIGAVHDARNVGPAQAQVPKLAIAECVQRRGFSPAPAARDPAGNAT